MQKFKYTSIDLFSGPGGLCTGFKWAGIKPLIAVEWNYWTAQTYAASHKADIFPLDEYLSASLSEPEKFFRPSQRTLVIFGDINKVDPILLLKILKERFGQTSVDIVSGGAPCESFSLAGQRKENDDRNVLYKNVLRIAKLVSAKLFLFENVKGLFSKKLNGKASGMYRQICADFQSFSTDGLFAYTLASTDKDTVLLKAVDYGVPQTRERLILIGLRNDLTAKFNYPEKTHGPDRKFAYVTTGDALLDLPKIKVAQESDKYSFDIDHLPEGPRKEFLKIVRGLNPDTPSLLKFNQKAITFHKAPNHTQKMLLRMQNIKSGENMLKAYERLIKEGKKNIADSIFPRKLYASRNRRLKLHEPSFTVTSHCLDEMIHPVSDRGLTPREVARLQSFPDWYIFKGPFVKFHSDPEQDLYEQIGDAVPPLLAYALGKEIVKTLDSAR